MMKKLLSVAAAVVMLLSACGPVDLPRAWVTEFPEMKVPVTFDTAWMMKADTSRRLSRNTVRELAAGFVKNAMPDGVTGTLNAFYKIDSLKTAGLYAEYADTLDIGMPRDAHAYAIGHGRLDDMTVYLWMLTEDSYEACPYSRRVLVCGTFTEGADMWTLPLCMNYSFTDPPVSYEWTIRSEMDGRTIRMRSEELSRDEDEPSENVRKDSAYTISLKQLRPVRK
jgi:hypothetical protein